MIIYTDNNNEPTYIAWVSPSDYRYVSGWLENHRQYTLGNDVVRTERTYLNEIAGYLHGRHLNGIPDNSGINLPYWHVWHCCELIRAE